MLRGPASPQGRTEGRRRGRPLGDEALQKPSGPTSFPQSRSLQSLEMTHDHAVPRNKLPEEGASWM